jgi:CRISPR-associated protein Cas1
LPTLYLTEDYAVVRRDSEDCLLVQIPEKRDEEGTIIPATKRRIPLAKVDSVVVLGEVTMTASAIHLLLERDTEIHYLSRYGHYKGSTSPVLTKNSLLRLAQHRGHVSIAQRSELARRFVIGKLSNQRRLLQRAHRREEREELGSRIGTIAMIVRKLIEMSVRMDTPAPLLNNGDIGISGTPVETILGLEGSGSNAYFGCFGMLMSDPQQWPFPGRIKRPATDPVNALLSFGYALLTTQVAAAVQIAGFDPHIGFLHSSTYGRPSLALDVMEEFRPLVVDSVVLTLLNNRMLTREDFVEELGAFRLKEKPRKLFLTRFEERLNEEITHPTFHHKVTYRRCIELQARLVAKYLTGEITEYPPIMMK